jgi:Flavin containing amine oxidoreductase
MEQQQEHEQQQQHPSPYYDVIVVGAGISGVAATHTLVQAGLSVLLLESTDRVGGRLQSHHLPSFTNPNQSITIDLGGASIHGKGSPLEEWIKIHQQQQEEQQQPQESMEQDNEKLVTCTWGSSIYPGQEYAEWLYVQPNQEEEEDSGEENTTATKMVQKLSQEQMKLVDNLFQEWDDLVEEYLEEKDTATTMGGQNSNNDLENNNNNDDNDIDLKTCYQSHLEELLLLFRQQQQQKEVDQDGHGTTLTTSQLRDLLNSKLFMANEMDSGLPLSDLSWTGFFHQWDFVSLPDAESGRDTTLLFGMQQAVEHLVRATRNVADIKNMSGRTENIPTATNPPPPHQQQQQSAPPTTLFTLKTNHRVSKIEYSSAVGSERSGSCRITTTHNNNDTYHASTCLVTLPLGVLKQSIRPSSSDDDRMNTTTNSFSSRTTTNAVGGGVTFVPPLPEWKQAAIVRGGLAIFNTLILQWNQPICEAGVTARYLSYSSSSSNAKASSNTTRTTPKNPLRHGFICPDALRCTTLAPKDGFRSTIVDPTSTKKGDGPSHVTQFYISGDRDEDGNLYPFDDLEFWKKHALEVVLDSMGSHHHDHHHHPGRPDMSSPPLLTCDDIVHAQITQWHLDPNFGASYSAPIRGTRGNDDRACLVQSIDDVIFFAGEHTNCKGRYQTMDGAYDTGVDTALQIISRLSLATTTELNTIEPL